MKIKDKLTVQYPGGLRLTGTILSIIQAQGKEPEYVVAFGSVYGLHGTFQANQIINHVSV